MGKVKRFAVSATLTINGRSLTLWAVDRYRWYMTAVNSPGDETLVYNALRDAMPSVYLLDDPDRVLIAESVVAAAISGDYVFSRRSR